MVKEKYVSGSSILPHMRRETPRRTTESKSDILLVKSKRSFCLTKKQKKTKCVDLSDLYLHNVHHAAADDGSQHRSRGQAYSCS